MFKKFLEGALLEGKSVAAAAIVWGRTVLWCPRRKKRKAAGIDGGCFSDRAGFPVSWTPRVKALADKDCLAKLVS